MSALIINYLKRILGKLDNLGNMKTSIYDPNTDGIVKDSDKLEASTKDQVQDHTPKAHTLGSHSTKAHSELTDVTANQHHAQVHTHPFPTPDYDSGWVQKPDGLNWFNHNLGSMELFVYVRYSHNANGSDNRLFQCHQDGIANRIINSNVNSTAVHHDKPADMYWRVMIWKL